MSNHCLNCDKPTSNPKFCSRSCAAIHNNKTPKRKRSRTCKNDGCNSPILSSRTYCEKHNPTVFSVPDVSMAEVRGKRSYQKHSVIRHYARKQYNLSGRPMSCSICGYDKHVHICHIKAISDFQPHDRLDTINHMSNLVALCPNHHWELDNNLLTISDIT
jgi:predicted restriction endonuclease